MLAWRFTQDFEDRTRMRKEDMRMYMSILISEFLQDCENAVEQSVYHQRVK